MFPEYRELITQLKTTDHHFGRLFEQHNALDQKIKNMESRIETGTPEAIELFKKEKLQLKDQLYTILRKADSPYGVSAFGLVSTGAGRQTYWWGLVGQ